MKLTLEIDLSKYISRNKYDKKICTKTQNRKKRNTWTMGCYKNKQVIHFRSVCGYNRKTWILYFLGDLFLRIVRLFKLDSFIIGLVGVCWRLRALVEL